MGEVRGNVIVMRSMKKGEITTDTTLTSLADRFGFDVEQLRRRPFPFIHEVNGESFHFQKMRVKQDVQPDGLLYVNKLN